MNTLFFVRLFSQIKKIFWITIAWTVISLYQYFIVVNTIEYFDFKVADEVPGNYLAGTLVVGLSAGIIGGSMIVYLWEKWLRTKKYGTALFYIFTSFTVAFLLVNMLGGISVQSAKLSLPLTHPEVASAALGHMFPLDLANYFFWLATVLITMVAFQVNDKYGPGVFRDFLLGKYFQPRKEERIFMFFDMRSSTTIAEKLGEEKYFNLIRELFSDATAPIIYSKGEIYQYVGDEIVISWKMKNGLTENNCLKCFFEIQNKFAQQASKYKNKYGLMPEFKAGLHFGHVMAGEVGVVKRDIAFSGDVLNTTARIQGECNGLGVNILLSNLLLEKLDLPKRKFEAKQLGEMLLRGKSEKVKLWTVDVVN